MKVEPCDLNMSADLTLVRLYKPRSRKEKQTVLDDKNKGKDPKKDIMALKVEETKVMYNVQTAEIVAINKSNKQYEVGDIVIVDYRKLRDFDLFKNVSVVNTYDIMGKVLIEGKDYDCVGCDDPNCDCASK
jgi:hypothetical protein